MMFRPYISRELPGWGKLYLIFIGDYRRIWLWKNAPVKTIRGKLHGYLMELNLAHWSDRAVFFLGRWYSLDIQLLMSDLIRPTDTVIDIGANHGMFALTAAQLVGDKGKVICFEPNPKCLAVLDKAIATNGIKNIAVNRCGLSDQKGELTLSVPFINSGEGTFGKPAYDGGSTYQVQVDVKIGDDLLRHEKPALIKIDVEGFEYKVISGLVETIKKHHPVFVTEVVAQHLEACNTSVEELTDLMKGFGYTGFKLGLKKHGSRYDWELTDFNSQESPFDAVWLHAEVLKNYKAILQEHGVPLSFLDKSQPLENN